MKTVTPPTGSACTTCRGRARWKLHCCCRFTDHLRYACGAHVDLQMDELADGRTVTAEWITP